MPSWDANGNEEWICQVCGRIKTGESTWMTPVPGKKFNGNVCKDCLKKIKDDTKKESVIEKINKFLSENGQR